MPELQHSAATTLAKVMQKPHPKTLHNLFGIPLRNPSRMLTNPKPQTGLDPFNIRGLFKPRKCAQRFIPRAFARLQSSLGVLGFRVLGFGV